MPRAPEVLLGNLEVVQYLGGDGLMEVDISEPHQQMLESLRDHGESDPDEDITQLVENAIHNGYQEMQRR